MFINKSKFFLINFKSFYLLILVKINFYRIRKINPDSKYFAKSTLLARKSLVFIPNSANPKDLLESSLDTLGEHFRFWSLKASFKADWNLEKEKELRDIILDKGLVLR